ncbi:MAG: hypothetical protein IMF18_10485 [Proteobacteria bacterium]|nr:hypothetical protein [Pseudomonadota bacterium]
MQMRTAPKGHRKNRFYLQLFFLILTAACVLSGCAAFGPRHIPRDRFSYNEALAKSTRDQMLLNLVRIRYLEEPVFLAVSSILTQYVYNAGAGVEASIDLGGGTDIATADANLSYEERPTITYIPIEGREFAQQMLSTIPAEVIFAAAQEGWTVETLMLIGLNRIGAVENMSFEHIPPPGQLDLSMQFQRELKKLKQFRHVIKLLVVLDDLEAYEVRHEVEKAGKKRFLVFAKDIPEEVQALVSELKQLLRLSPNRNKFLITGHATDVKEEEVSIQTRSLMAMMNFIAKGVEVPPEHLEEGRVLNYEMPTDKRSGKMLIPFRMHSSRKRPKDPFAAVRYHGYWFYIDNRDIHSKITLGTIISLFRVLAPTGGGAAPILTLPTG